MRPEYLAIGCFLICFLSRACKNKSIPDLDEWLFVTRMGKQESRWKTPCVYLFPNCERIYSKFIAHVGPNLPDLLVILNEGGCRRRFLLISETISQCSSSWLHPHDPFFVIWLATATPTKQHNVPCSITAVQEVLATTAANFQAAEARQLQAEEGPFIAVFWR